MDITEVFNQLTVQRGVLFTEMHGTRISVSMLSPAANSIDKMIVYLHYKITNFIYQSLSELYIPLSKRYMSIHV